MCDGWFKSYAADFNVLEDIKYIKYSEYAEDFVHQTLSFVRWVI